VEPRDLTAVNGTYHHGIHVNVHEDHQRRGIATSMVRFAQKTFSNLRHQNIRTDDAEAWGQGLGITTPPRMEVKDIKWRLGPGEPV
jgi:GNAT superfamily N-acetyltransferase